ncbi:MAG: hypothetical protein M1274_05875 [Actinobacteria bacterium]|nr:hypothetical protein [Actinomycetota bacterium]
MKRVRLTVNGMQRHVVADDALTLLDLLHDGLHLTGTKQLSCSPPRCSHPYA